MDLSAFFKRAGEVAAENSPAILTAIGVTGTLTTAYFAARAAFKSSDVIREEESVNGTADDPKERFKQRLDLTWKLYIPAATCAAMSVTAIICANRISDRRAAVLASAYTVMEKNLKNYRAKTLQKVGKNKEQAIRDEIAQDEVSANPPDKTSIMIVKDGSVLCFDSFSGRYFTGDHEGIRKAENDINWQILNDGYASLSDVWSMLGIRETDISDDFGWDSKVDLRISATLSEENRPCISVTFQPEPKPRFWKGH